MLTLPALRAPGITRRVASWENEGGVAPNKSPYRRSFFMTAGIRPLLRISEFLKVWRIYASQGLDRVRFDRGWFDAKHTAVCVAESYRGRHVWWQPKSGHDCIGL